MSRVALLGIGLGLLLAVAACSKPTREDRIEAANDTQFQAWLDQRVHLFTPAEVKEITDARQLVRYRVMQSKPGLPSDQFVAEVYSDINGKTIRDLLATGCALQIDRIEVELKNLQPLLEKVKEHRDGSHLSDEAKVDAQAKVADVERKINERQEELQRLQRRMEELRRGAPTPHA